MQLELNDVLAIITKNNEAMNRIITKWETEEADLYPEGLSELRDVLNTYTAAICMSIDKAETERVENMLKDMEVERWHTASWHFPGRANLIASSTC